jgi:TatD DNase family protein
MVFQYVLNTIKKQDPKILTVHSRGAARETISELINVLKGTHHHVILHWYSGKIDDMRQALAAGFSFSVNHKMVISRTGQQLVQALPKNSLLTETDAPFTFSESITNRQQSLQATIAGLARQWQCEPEEARNHVWQTFADVLKNTQAMKP